MKTRTVTFAEFKEMVEKCRTNSRSLMREPIDPDALNTLAVTSALGDAFRARMVPDMTTAPEPCIFNTTGAEALHPWTCTACAFRRIKPYMG